MSEPKTRPDSLAGQLRTVGLFEEFGALMFEQAFGYDECLKWLASKQIESSIASLSRFHASQKSPYFLARGRAMLAETSAMLPDEMDDIERRVVLQRCFEAASDPNTPMKDLLNIRSVRVREQQIKIAQEQLKQAESRIEQQAQQIEMQERRITAQEEAAKAAMLAAQRTKEALTAGGMDEETRQRLVAEMDHILLGKPKPAKSESVTLKQS